MSLHPHDVAKLIALKVEADILAASQIKEHIPAPRLLELLNIPRQDLEEYLEQLSPTEED